MLRRVFDASSAANAAASSASESRGGDGVAGRAPRTIPRRVAKGASKSLEGDGREGTRDARRVTLVSETEKRLAAFAAARVTFVTFVAFVVDFFFFAAGASPSAPPPASSPRFAPRPVRPKTSFEKISPSDAFPPPTSAAADVFDRRRRFFRSLSRAAFSFSNRAAYVSALAYTPFSGETNRRYSGEPSFGTVQRTRHPGASGVPVNARDADANVDNARASAAFFAVSFG